MYLVLVDIDFDPTGKHYEAGKAYPLKGWRKKHIARALQAGLIDKAGEDKEDECQDR